MGFDKLKVYVPQDGPYGLEPEEGGEPVEEETCYLKSDADAVMAELKDERDAFEESLNEMTEAFMQSQRALWLARAIAAKRERDYWYHVHSITRSLDGEWFKVNHRGQGHLGLYKRPIEWVKTWDNVRELCYKKAEEHR